MVTGDCTRDILSYREQFGGFSQNHHDIMMYSRMHQRLPCAGNLVRKSMPKCDLTNTSLTSSRAMGPSRCETRDPIKVHPRGVRFVQSSNTRTAAGVGGGRYSWSLLSRHRSLTSRPTRPRWSGMPDFCRQTPHFSKMIPGGNKCRYPCATAPNGTAVKHPGWQNVALSAGATIPTAPYRASISARTLK